MWLNDLDLFLDKLDKIEAKQENEIKKADKLKKAPKKAKLQAPKRKKNKEVVNLIY